MWLVLCLFVLPLRYTDGSLADQMAEITQLCCNQGTSYARNHSAEDCSSSIPPDVPSTFGTLCIFAMDQCCKEYFTKKVDCERGVEVAVTLKTCASTKESAKRCCDQCMSGVAVGKARGASSCSALVHGKSTEQLLAGDAFSDCCKNATANQSNSSSRNSVTVSKKPADNDLSVVSECEAFAPNELCAHHCIPIPGSYRCECNPGFMLMADGRNCREVTKNRCKPHNPCQHKCNDNGIQVMCSCKRGYKLMADKKSCEDIDECSLESPVCLPNMQCHNIQGSYKCIPIKNKGDKSNGEKGQCPAGFAKNLLNNACDDINECNLPNPPCPSYICENTIGGYKCGGASGDPANLGNKEKPPVEDRCPPGFISGLNEECEDIDECSMEKDDCNKISQFCINTRGYFYCQDKVSKHCPPGFKNNPITNKCEDINECEDGQDICKSDQVCINVPGEYDCKPKPISEPNNKYNCPDGMRENQQTHVCEDIDECVEGTHLCDQYQKCLNTNGSHECRCKLGFEMDHTTGACIDINECATDQNNCLPEIQRCDNTVGSFLCIRFISCGTGYTLHHSSSTCEDIDECALGLHNCDRAGPDYQCFNIPGSFRCQKQQRTPPTPSPEYEYEYYDSEEEIEEEKANTTKTVVTTTVVVVTTTVLVAAPNTTETPQTTPKIIATEPTPEEPKAIPDTKRPDDSPIKIDNNVGVDFNREIQNPKPKEPETKEEEPGRNIHDPEPSLQPVYQPNVENVEPQVTDRVSQTPPEPTEPNYYKPTEPSKISEPTTTEIDNNIPDIYPKVPETTYSPIQEYPTSPKFVYVNVGKSEEATVQGEKHEDGSVSIDTNLIPENKWTKVVESPPVCQSGFELDKHGACFDIDECTTNRHSCSGLTEVCRNTIGGFLCDCAFNFRRVLPSMACVPFTTSSTSTSTTSSPTTSSTTSTTSTTTSTTTTTTTTTPAPTTSSTKKSDFWGYRNRRPTTRPFRPRNNCDVGYVLRIETGKCEDVNECTNGQANCASEEVCVNTEGGFRCECPADWRLDPERQRCVPLWTKGQFPPGYRNEPVYPPLDPNEILGPKENNPFPEPEIPQTEDWNVRRYKCPWGTRLGDNNVCEDIDECATGEAQCGPLQICTNLPGGYICSCPVGHKWISDHQCQDIDECSLGGSSPICSQNAECVNTVGSYQCRCHEGFKSAPVNDKVCVDVDECSESRPGSLCQQRCNNVWGGYRCSCHRGYRLNSDNRTCHDVDECTEFKNKNLCIGRCHNEPGSYRCSCPSGYRLSEDKRSCIDIDECETGAATCSYSSQSEGTNDVCLNTRGSYRCYKINCPQGYQLESKHRCTKIERNCPPSDWECAHQPSTYSYNFITFVSNLYIPESKVDLFTMRGPAWPAAKMRFQLRVVNVDAPPSVKEKADINSFLLVQTANQAVMSLVRPLQGLQSIELELSMELYSRGQFGGIAVAKIYIHVSEYEF